MCQIAVIIPAYNRENLLGKCLDSLMAQSYSDWGAIIIDDGSTDGTLDVARDYCRRDPRIEAHGFPNGGAAAARNRGLGLVPEDSPYVIFLDSDDFLEPHALETLVRALEGSPSAVAAYGLAREIDANEEPTVVDTTRAFGFTRNVVVDGKRRIVNSECTTSFAHFVVWICIATPGQVLIRTSAIRQTEGFDTSTVPSEDWDMWIQLSLIGDFSFVREFVMCKRDHAGGISKNGKLLARAEPVIRHKLANLIPLTSEQRSLARKGHFLSCAMKLDWARDDLRNGLRKEAARKVYRAGKSYFLYRKTWKREQSRVVV